MAVEEPSLHSNLSSPPIISKAMKRCYWSLKECHLEHWTLKTKIGHTSIILGFWQEVGQIRKCNSSYDPTVIASKKEERNHLNIISQSSEQD